MRTVDYVRDTLSLEPMITPEEAMTALGLSLGKLGNVRTQTLRAFSATEMKAIIGKVA